MIPLHVWVGGRGGELVRASQWCVPTSPHPLTYQHKDDRDEDPNHRVDEIKNEESESLRRRRNGAGLDCMPTSSVSGQAWPKRTIPGRRRPAATQPMIASSSEYTPRKAMAPVTAWPA